jgi:predicted permease
VFTVVQIAAAVVVTIAGALLLRSFLRLEAIDRGFDPVNLSLVAVVTPEDRFPDRRARLALFDRLTRRLAGLPGVMSATSIHMGPGTGSGGLSARMLFEGQTPDEAKTNPYATFDSVMPSYFDTMGIPIVEGRPFSEADREGARRVVIVSQSVADRYWPGERAIGKTVRFEADAEPAEVVGVAREMRYRELTRTWLTVYFPAHEFFWFKPAALAVRTASAPAALVPSIRAALRVEEPTVAIAEVLGMPEALAAETSRQRTALAIIAFFAITATLLSAIGVYSVLGYEVGYRRRELAVRSALGADPARLFRAVVGRSAVLGIAGLAIGAAVALPATRALDSLLFEVDRADPVSFAASAGLMLIVTLVGASLPAIRAARTDPVSCLRSE